ncbi:MAG: DUF2461 domain-containing protein [Bacteroidetes bacterium]|nr:DUF2461 domain-containing protein [Bacteroidota bacterium]
MLQAATIKFLKDLKKNNNKPWFDANRKRYEDAKQDYAQFIQSVLEKHSKKDAAIKDLKAKDCMFRINRDIRFSKDKSPYKTNFGASINRGGKKSIYAGYYFHLEPSESFVGGGLWMPTPQDLKKVRQEIDYNLDEFKKIITSKKFKSVYSELYKGEDVSLTKVPQGFEKDNPAAEYIKLKSFIAMKKFNEADILGKTLEKQVLEAFETLQPLVEFINKALEE